MYDYIYSEPAFKWNIGTCARFFFPREIRSSLFSLKVENFVWWTHFVHFTQGQICPLSLLAVWVCVCVGFTLPSLQKGCLAHLILIHTYVCALVLKQMHMWWPQFVFLAVIVYQFKYICALEWIDVILQLLQIFTTILPYFITRASF